MRATLLVLLLGVLVACSAGPGSGPLPLPRPTPTAAPLPPTETLVPLREPTPPSATLLPRSLYFLSGPEGAQQVWRLEADGITATQLTDEAEGISDFDVSPVDGALVYVRRGGHELIRTDGSGGNPTSLYTMLPQEDPGSPLVTIAIRAPRWSPDGSQVVFGLNGVNMIPAGGGERQLLLASDPPPDPNGGRGGAIRFYHPHSWSPDGKRLLVSVLYFPEGGDLALFDLSTAALAVLQSEGGNPCCTPGWSADGSVLFLGNDSFGYVRPGLWQVQVEEGEITMIGGPAAPQTDLPPIVATYPQPAADGFLYAWRRESAASLTIDDLMMQPPVLQRAPLAQADDPAAWQIVLDDPMRPIEVRWAPDGSGAVVSVDEGQGMEPDGNALLWVPTDGTALHPLPVQGSSLRWGP